MNIYIYIYIYIHTHIIRDYFSDWIFQGIRNLLLPTLYRCFFEFGTSDLTHYGNLGQTRGNSAISQLAILKSCQSLPSVRGVQLGSNGPGCRLRNVWVLSGRASRLVEWKKWISSDSAKQGFEDNSQHWFFFCHSSSNEHGGFRDFHLWNGRATVPNCSASMWAWSMVLRQNKHICMHTCL